MEIEQLIEFEGYHIMSYVTKGHVDKKEFRNKAIYDYDPQQNGQKLLLDKARHRYARLIPACGTSTVCYHFYDKPGRGAFPVTVCDVV